MNQKQLTYASVHTYGIKALGQVRDVPALVIFHVLGDTPDYECQPEALLSESDIIARMGGQPQESLRKLKQRSERILEQYSQPTVRRANALTALAEAEIGFQCFSTEIAEHDLSRISQILDEAIAIYNEQGVPERKAAAVFTRGLLFLIQGEFEDTLGQFTRADQLQTIGIHRVVPATFDSELRTGAQVPEFAGARP